MQKLKELWDKIGVQFIKFGMVGVSNTVVSLATYYLFTFFGVHYLIANALGFVTGTLNAYYWNSKFVFKEEAKESGNKKESLVKTYISYGFSFSMPKYAEEILAAVTERSSIPRRSRCSWR